MFEDQLFTVYFEGPDGTGKTSLASAFADLMFNCQAPTMLVREPGGVLQVSPSTMLVDTQLQEQLRDLLKAGNYSRDPYVTGLLMHAARLETETVINKWCQDRSAGGVVVSDRSPLSTLVYQHCLPAFPQYMKYTDVDNLLRMHTPARFPWLMFPRNEVKYVLVLGQIRPEDDDHLAGGHSYGDVEQAYLSCAHGLLGATSDTVVLRLEKDRPLAHHLALMLGVFLGGPMKELIYEFVGERSVSELMSKWEGKVQMTTLGATLG